jgi:hypothetical protein
MLRYASSSECFSMLSLHINAPLCFVEPVLRYASSNRSSSMLLIVQGRYGVSKVITIMNLVQRE